jgi:hypothetical protein
MDPSYPVTFSVDYPDRDLNRLTTAFRVFTVIPIAILLGLVSGGDFTSNDPGGQGTTIAIEAGGLVFLPTVLMLLFRKKYPRWWFDWNLELMRFSARVGVYFLLMDDRYPSTDEQQSVRLDFPYPDAERELSRGLPIVKWFLAIPHYVVLFFVDIAALVMVVAAWFAILFTGRYPQGIFEFLEGIARWHVRVWGYAFTLVTDRYPPFRLGQ